MGGLTLICRESLPIGASSLKPDPNGYQD